MFCWLLNYYSPTLYELSCSASGVVQEKPFKDTTPIRQLCLNKELRTTALWAGSVPLMRGRQNRGNRERKSSVQEKVAMTV